MFALSIIRYFHLLADHNRRRAKLGILKAGFICLQLENVLWETEQRCQECRLRKGMNVAKNSGLCTQVSGSSFGLANVAFNTQSHTFATDCWGPFQSNDGILHGILFVSLSTGMCYSFVLQEMTAEGVIQAVQCLSAVAGNCTVMISDQGSNYTPYSDIFKMSDCDSSEDESEAGLQPSDRKPRNPLARLLCKSKSEGNCGGISWKLVCAENHSQNGVSEAAVKIIKRSLRHSRFNQHCKSYNLSKVSASIAIATTLYNTRPCFALDDGEIYSPFDIMSLTTAGASAPENELNLYSDSAEIRSKFKEYKMLREEIQQQIFQHYCKYIYLNSNYKERGKFQCRSDNLQPGDLVISKAAFSQSKNISKSIRRIHKLNPSKRQAVVYHVVEAGDNFDTELFNISFAKCNSVIEKRRLVRKYFGRFSFQSIDLREVTFLCGSNTECLELSMRRSRKPEKMQDFENPLSFCFDNLHKRLKSTAFRPSINTPALPLQAADMMLDNEWSGEKNGDDNIVIKCPKSIAKEKLTLKWAEPEAIIHDIPNMSRNTKPPNRKKSKNLSKKSNP